MTCDYCFKNHSYYAAEGWHDITGEKVRLEGGFDNTLITDNSTIEVGYSYEENGEWCHGYLNIEIKSEWEEDVEFSILGKKYEETSNESFVGDYLVDIKYCPFCGSKLGTRFEGGTDGQERG